MMRSVIFGVLATVAIAFPIGAFLGFIFRFPVPFDGIEGGVEHMIPSLIAVFWYGTMGGFPLLAVLGAGCGAVAHGLAKGNRQAVRRLAIALSFGMASLALFCCRYLTGSLGPGEVSGRNRMVSPNERRVPTQPS